jgi:hypothetical protein
VAGHLLDLPAGDVESIRNFLLELSKKGLIRPKRFLLYSWKRWMPYDRRERSMSDTCNRTDICEQVQELYTKLALHPEGGFAWGKGKENARVLGYAEKWLELLPDAVWESAAAVGNPFAIGWINVGETVLDLGCGAGADVCIAALHPRNQRCTCPKGGEIFINGAAFPDLYRRRRR